MARHVPEDRALPTTLPDRLFRQDEYKPPADFVPARSRHDGNPALHLRLREIVGEVALMGSIDAQAAVRKTSTQRGRVAVHRYIADVPIVLRSVRIAPAQHLSPPLPARIAAKTHHFERSGKRYRFRPLQRTPTAQYFDRQAVGGHRIGSKRHIGGSEIKGLDKASHGPA
jgi:hypothetical protein